MLAHHGKRWVYLGVPRTGSTTLHHSADLLGAEEVAPQHVMQVPEALRSYRVYASVMGPYRRAVSLWYLFQRDHAKQAAWTLDLDEASAHDFPRFTRKVMVPERPHLNVYQWTVDRWLALAGEGLEIVPIHTERLTQELIAADILPKGVVLPRRARTRVGDWRAVYDDESAERVRAWGAPDFARFGYDEDLASYPAPESDATPKGESPRWRRLLRRMRG